MGQLLTSKSLLRELRHATLTQLDALNGLSPNANVQIVIRKTQGLIDEFNRFLAQNVRAGQRIDSVRTGIDADNVIAGSFLPTDEVTAGPGFELLNAVRVGGIPVFEGSSVGVVRELPDSSFISWLKLEQIGPELLTVTPAGQIQFAPGLAEAPNGIRESPLGELSMRLHDEIARSGQASQTVSILGTTVPGSLVLIAAPLILLSLAYYFMNHISRLARLINDDRSLFDQFAWLPLNLRCRVTRPLGGVHHLVIHGGVLELLMSGIVLPVAAIGMLYFKLSMFGNLGVAWRDFMIAAVLGIVIFGVLSLSALSTMKEWLNRGLSR